MPDCLKQLGWGRRGYYMFLKPVRHLKHLMRTLVTLTRVRARAGESVPMLHTSPDLYLSIVSRGLSMLSAQLIKSVLFMKIIYGFALVAH